MLTHFGSQAVATSAWDLIFMLLVKAALPDGPRACIPPGQRASGMKRKDNLRAAMGHADWRVHQSLGLSFSGEYRKQSVLWASAGFGAHTDLQTKDQPLQIFSNWSNHDVEDGILFPFFCG